MINDKFKALGDTIFYAAICFYILVLVGIILVILLAIVIYKQISLRKKSKEKSDDKDISKSLRNVNILTYILIALIVFFGACWLII